MSEQLEQKFIQAKQLNAQTVEGQKAFTQLVEEILRWRTICRPLMGESLTEAQITIYEQLKQQLLLHLSEQINFYHSDKIPIKIWATGLLHQALKDCLTDDLLKKFAIEIQKISPNTVLHRHLLGELIEAIKLSGKLCQAHREKFTPNFYELLYEEAMIRTFAYICKNIHQYDPDRGEKQKFMNWVNFRLDRLVIECRREFNDLKVEALPTLTDLENISMSAADSLLEETIQYIESDPNDHFKQEHIRNRPDANFQAVALARLSGNSWEEISAQYDIRMSTLSSFFQRCCTKFRPQFQKDLMPD
jgi:DNA-directed RNA polymerase specialized sigma24 family protein